MRQWIMYGWALALIGFAAQQALEASQPRYLFIDREHVQRLSLGVEQVFHLPTRVDEPIMVPELAWEGTGFNRIMGGPIWCDERQRWRLWYAAGSLPLYAESEDGVTWQRPSLGLVEHEGSTDNNIIKLQFDVDAPAKSNRMYILRDDHETDPSRRYKGMTYIRGQMTHMVSADGLTWRQLTQSHMTDDEYSLGYDAIHQRFIATVKLNGSWQGTARGSHPVTEFGRVVSLSVSEDFANWTVPELIFWADEVDEALGRQRIEAALRGPAGMRPTDVHPDQFHTDVYRMHVFTYEDLYLGLAMMFNQSGPLTRVNQDGIIYPQLVASRDLRNWDRLNRQPFLPRAADSDEIGWGHGQLDTRDPVLHGEDLWFYSTGSWHTHGHSSSAPHPRSAMFLAKMRRDGFASLYAGEDGGQVLTRVVTVTGPKLYVSVDASDGELRAEIRDAATGVSINGYSLGDMVRDRYIARDPLRWRVGTGARLRGDPVENQTVPVTEDTALATVQWKDNKDVSELVGREVRISFYLKNAHLYSFWFDE